MRTFMSVILAMFVLTTTTAADPVRLVNQDGVWVDQCDSYYHKDVFSGKWVVSIRLHYQMVAGGVLTAGVKDDANREWYAADPVIGIALAGNRAGWRTFDFTAAKGSDLEAQMISGGPLTVFGRLAPAVRGVTPIVDVAPIYAAQQ